MGRTDVVVAGGGPAGAATALALRRHDPDLGIVLVEASEYAEVRIGESLPPNARPYLERLGVFERFLGEEPLESYGTSSSWGRGELADNDFVTGREGPGWHLDRRRFDAFLTAEAARAGVEVIAGSRLAGEEHTAEGWVLELEGRPARLEARYVVDATGRGARLATRQGSRRVLFDHLAGVFLFFGPGQRQVPPDTRTLVEAVEPGWWYSARLPGGGLVAAFMSDSALVRELGVAEPGAWLELAAASRHTRQRLEGLEPRGEPVVKAASSGRLDRFAGGGWLAVGDAASTFDPVSGQGIVKALAGGLWAAFAAADALADRPHAAARYDRLLAGEFEGYLETREYFYREESRWPDSPFWRRRRVEVTLDPNQDLVRANEASAGRLRMYLPAADLARLAALCETPRPAHQVVASFRSSGLSDRRIVLALQYLLEEGVLRSMDGVS